MNVRDDAIAAFEHIKSEVEKLSDPAVCSTDAHIDNPGWFVGLAVLCFSLGAIVGHVSA